MVGEIRSRAVYGVLKRGWAWEDAAVRRVARVGVCLATSRNLPRQWAGGDRPPDSPKFLVPGAKAFSPCRLFVWFFDRFLKQSEGVLKKGIELLLDIHDRSYKTSPSCWIEV
jgi:hypothetical protein